MPADSIADELMRRYQLKPESADEIAKKILQPKFRGPGGHNSREKINGEPGAVQRPVTAPARAATQLHIDETLAHFLPATPQRPILDPMKERDDRVQGTLQFFSPEAEKRRAAAPDYWASLAGQERLREMEQRQADMQSRNENFRSLTPKKTK